MALSVLLHPHEDLVKEEEEDSYDIDYNESMNLPPLMDSGDSTTHQSSPIDESVGDVSVEMNGLIKEEEEESLTSPLPLFSGVPVTLAPSRLEASNHAKDEDRPIKEEPIDPCEEDSHRSLQNTNSMDHPDFGVAALLSLAGQDHAENVQQLAIDLFHEPKLEEIDEDTKNVSLLQQGPSNLGDALKLSPGFSESSDDKNYADVVGHKKRGRPMGKRFSDEEVAADPKKRRQANNREAALRYREKKKAETWELLNEQKYRQGIKLFLMERVDDLNREVQKWKRRCFKEFGFLPEFDFEDNSPIPFPPSSRLRAESWSKDLSEESNDQDSAPQKYDRQMQNRIAAAKLRAKRKEAQDKLKKEEAEFTARNECLRSDALQLYLEVVNFRKKMGLSKVRTTADTELPSLLRSSHFSSDQISEYLSSSQS